MQLGYIFRIPFEVACEFLFPEFGVCFGQCGVPASLVAVPETAVNEDRCLVFGQDDVGLPRELRVVEPEAETCAVQRLPNTHFWGGVLSLDTGHHARSGTYIYDVGQRLRPSWEYATWCR